MKIYEVESESTYWVVADNAIQAFEVARRTWEEESRLEEVGTEKSIHIDEVEEARARQIKIQTDDEVGPQRRLWDLARDATVPSVVACSEW